MLNELIKFFQLIIAELPKPEALLVAIIYSCPILALSSFGCVIIALIKKRKNKPFKHYFITSFIMLLMGVGGLYYTLKTYTYQPSPTVAALLFGQDSQTKAEQDSFLNEQMKYEIKQFSRKSTEIIEHCTKPHLIDNQYLAPRKVDVVMCLYPIIQKEIEMVKQQENEIDQTKEQN